MFKNHDGVYMIQFELTSNCNMNCKTCYIHKNKEAGRVILPASFWLEKARQAATEGMLVLSLTGGEILLYPELDELMSGLSEIGLLISFNTNGTLIDEKRVEWFLKYVPHKINISLYGASDESYETFCGIHEGFTKTANAIDLLQKAGLNVYLNGMITPFNVHELPEMHRFAASRGLILHAVSYVYPSRSFPGLNVFGRDRLLPENAARVSLINARLQYGPDRFLQMGAGCLVGIEHRRREALGGICRNCEACNGGISNFQISFDGKLHPCAMFQMVSVSLEEYAFSDAWKLVREQMNKIPFPDQCNACERKDICPMCKAAVYLETGTTTEAPEYLCRYSKKYEEILRKECGDVSGSLQYCRNLYPDQCAY